MERDTARVYTKERRLVMHEVVVDAVDFVSKMLNMKPTDVFEINPITKKLYRGHKHTLSRHMVRYYMRYHSDLTLKEIAYATKCNHPNVLSSVAYINDYAEFSATFKAYKDSLDNKSLADDIELTHDVRGILDRYLPNKHISHREEIINDVVELINKIVNERKTELAYE